MMRVPRIDRKRTVGVLALFGTAVLSLAFVAIPSDTLIGFVGTENVFLFMYVIAFLGSVTTFASIPYPLILLGLAAGGIDPLKIGLVSALGVITADTCTFFAARKGGALLGEGMKAALLKLSGYIAKYPRLVTPGLMVYGTLSPLSNDFAVISLSLMRYAYHRVVLPLAVGNVVYNLSVAYLGVYAYDWIVAIF